MLEGRIARLRIPMPQSLETRSTQPDQPQKIICLPFDSNPDGENSTPLPPGLTVLNAWIGTGTLRSVHSFGQTVIAMFGSRGNHAIEPMLSVP
jgi:hypothetical protein